MDFTDTNGSPKVCLELLYGNANICRAYLAEVNPDVSINTRDLSQCIDCVPVTNDPLRLEIFVDSFDLKYNGMMAVSKHSEICANLSKFVYYGTRGGVEPKYLAQQYSKRDRS